MLAPVCCIALPSQSLFPAHAGMFCVSCKQTLALCVYKSNYLYFVHYTNIIQVGNSKGLRLPKDFVQSLGAGRVLLQRTKEGILITPAPAITPAKEWSQIMANKTVTTEDEWQEWDATLSDGLEPWEE